MSQWAEIRQMHLVEGMAKKEIARRLGLDIKTVRRALESGQAPARRSGACRPSQLDPWREQIERWLVAEPRLTAQRIGRLLQEQARCGFSERTVRQYVARLRGELFAREAFVHRTAAPAMTLEVDFGQSRAFVARRMRTAHFLVATLPSCNAYFAKSYPIERLECLLDGLGAAFVFHGGLAQRVVLDNTSLAVKEIHSGPARTETQAFGAFRGAWPFAAEYCAPAKGWEKGSVEGGVKYVRNNFFRPIPHAESWEQLNAALEQGLRRDMERRRLEDGRTVLEAWQAERALLRPLPLWRPEPCRVLTRMADKFGHVRIERVHYSVPIRHAWRPVVVKLFHDRVVICLQDRVVATHRRSFQTGAKVLEVGHVLPLLERKSRAVEEATALRTWHVPAVLERLRDALRGHTRKPDREWIGVLRVLEQYPQEQVEAAAAQALERGSPRLATIAMILRNEPAGAPPPCAALEREELTQLHIAPASLEHYDHLWREEDEESCNAGAAFGG